MVDGTLYSYPENSGWGLGVSSGPHLCSVQWDSGLHVLHTIPLPLWSNRLFLCLSFSTNFLPTRFYHLRVTTDSVCLAAMPSPTMWARRSCGEVTQGQQLTGWALSIGTWFLQPPRNSWVLPPQTPSGHQAPQQTGHWKCKGGEDVNCGADGHTLEEEDLSGGNKWHLLSPKLSASCRGSINKS